jgi:hypothetical protein
MGNMYVYGKSLRSLFHMDTSDMLPTPAHESLNAGSTPRLIINASFAPASYRGTSPPSAACCLPIFHTLAL